MDISILPNKLEKLLLCVSSSDKIKNIPKSLKYLEINENISFDFSKMNALRLDEKKFDIRDYFDLPKNYVIPRQLEIVSDYFKKDIVINKLITHKKYLI